MEKEKKKTDISRIEKWKEKSYWSQYIVKLQNKVLNCIEANSLRKINVSEKYIQRFYTAGECESSLSMIVE